MRKALVLLFVMALCFGLAACAGDSKSAINDPSFDGMPVDHNYGG